MKGEVQVFAMGNNGEQRLLKESNLIMDGFGECVATILTTPSSIVSNAEYGVSDDVLQRLDTSNFTIGSIAFGKGTKGFMHNAHDIKNVNMLGFSENLFENFDATATWVAGNWGNTPTCLLSVTSSTETAGDLSSSVTHLNASSASTSRVANNLSQFVTTKPLNALYDSLNFSVDFKFDFENASQSCNADNERFSAISISQTSSTATPYDLISQRFNTIKWDVSGNGTLLNSSEDPNGDFSHGYIKKLGNGWHRLTCVLEPAYYQALPSTDILYPYWFEQGSITSSLDYNGHPLYDDQDYETEEIAGSDPSIDRVGYIYGTIGVDLDTLDFGYGPNTTAQFSFFLKKTDSHVRLSLTKYSPVEEVLDLTLSATNGDLITTTASSINHSYEVIDYSSEWFKINFNIVDTVGDAERYRILIYPKGDASAPTNSCVVWGPKLFLKRDAGFMPSLNHDITCTIYPTLPIPAKALSGSDRLNLTVDPSDLTGGIYISRPSLSYGTSPAIYTPTTGYDSDYPVDPLHAYLVEMSVNFYGLSGQGTLYSDTSSVHPISNPPRIPNPKDKLLEYGVRLPVESYKDYVFDIDKNLNYLGFPTHELPIEGVESSDSIDGFGLRGDARHFGAYCPSAGAVISLLSGTGAADYRTPASSVEYSAGVNHPDRRTMDKNGHINAYYPTRGETQDAFGRLIVSANPDFSSTGELSCICIIPSGDAAVANMYGGIFEAGLYAMDHEELLKNAVIPFGVASKSVDIGKDFNYKLIAKKTFNDNIVVARDYLTSAGIALHGNIKLVWRLKFL